MKVEELRRREHDFAMWLSGFVDALGGATPTPAQWEAIVRRLRALGSDPNEPSFTPITWPNTMPQWPSIVDPKIYGVAENENGVMPCAMTEPQLYE